VEDPRPPPAHKEHHEVWSDEEDEEYRDLLDETPLKPELPELEEEEDTLYRRLGDAVFGVGDAAEWHVVQHGPATPPRRSSWEAEDDDGLEFLRVRAEQAAVRIQAMQRGKAARGKKWEFEAAKMKAEELALAKKKKKKQQQKKREESGRERAALQIQQMTRQRVARKKVAAQKQDKAEAEIYLQNVTALGVTAVKCHPVRTAKEVAALAKEEEDAVIRIQRIGRGRMGRKRADRHHLEFSSKMEEANKASSERKAEINKRRQRDEEERKEARARVARIGRETSVSDRHVKLTEAEKLSVDALLLEATLKRDRSLAYTDKTKHFNYWERITFHAADGNNAAERIFWAGMLEANRIAALKRTLVVHARAMRVDEGREPEQRDEADALLESIRDNVDTRATEQGKARDAEIWPQEVLR